MHSLEEDLDYTSNKIRHLEESIARLQDAVLHHADQIKETQRFLVKVAYNQSEIAKRLASWPYIAVEKDDSQGEI